MGSGDEPQEQHSAAVLGKERELAQERELEREREREREVKVLGQLVPGQELELGVGN